MRRTKLGRACRIAVPSCLGVTLILGCAAPWTSKEPKLTEVEKKGRAVREIFNSEDRPRLIHEICGQWGVFSRKYESFGLVTQLQNTGGDVRPSPQRDYILKEMRANDAPNPNAALASKQTAVVLVQTIASPATQRNQRVDAVVSISKECEATSLQNGYLLEARLHEHQEAGGALLGGHEKARVSGPILHMPRGFVPKGEPRKEKVDTTRGIVLSGARLLDTRMIGLKINSDFAHAMTSVALEKAINEHFFFFDGRDRRGVAKAKDDGFVELNLPTRYRQDPYHFLDAVLHLGFREKPDERTARLELAKRSLQEPTTARRAALQLETMGRDGTTALQSALSHSNPEIRFYAAYSLAYMDDPLAVPALESLARDYRAFRKLSLVGLSLIEHYDAREAIERLLQFPEPEVRYGAVDALKQRADQSEIAFSKLGDVANLVEVPSEIPMVAVSLQYHPEVAIFGNNPPIYLADFLEVSPRLVMRLDSLGGIRVSRFSRDGDRVNVVTPDLKSVLDAIREVGGTYNDMVQFIDTASEKGILPYPVEWNPRPKRDLFMNAMPKRTCSKPM